MKINELLNEQEQLDELDPGQVPGRLDPRRYFGQGRANKLALKQDKQMSANLYKMWHGYAVRLDRALANDPEKANKTIQYFKGFLSKALRIPANSPMLAAGGEIDSLLGNGMNYNKNTVMQAIDKAVQQRLLAGLPTVGGGPGPGGGPGGRPTSIPGGTTQTAGGVEYVWNGSEWRNSTTGATATAAIASALTASVTRGGTS